LWSIRRPRRHRRRPPRCGAGADPPSRPHLRPSAPGPAKTTPTPSTRGSLPRAAPTSLICTPSAAASIRATTPSRLPSPCPSTTAAPNMARPARAWRAGRPGQPAGTAERLPVPAFADAITAGPPPTVVPTSWVQFRRGWRVDLPALARIAHDSGALLCADVIQGLGVIPSRLDAGAWTCRRPQVAARTSGTGLLYVRGEHRDRLRPLEPGWNFMATGNNRTNSGSPTTTAHAATKTECRTSPASPQIKPCDTIFGTHKVTARRDDLSPGYSPPLRSPTACHENSETGSDWPAHLTLDEERASLERAAWRSTPAGKDD
jgi:hypothetical protein